MNEFEENIETYIDHYDIEKHLFLNGAEWIKKGWLDKPEFLEICLWKSRRPKRFYEQNNNFEIREFTEKAFAESNEKTKIELLTNLKGVSIPTASAILCVTNSIDFPIIDIRCIETLVDLKLIYWSNINLNSWGEYLNIVRQLAKKHNKTARELEKGLFAYNRIKLDKQYKNLYKYGNSKTKNV
ncbi:MAG: hypothetical protein ABI851_14175 [Saprospiraceae bacterium]